MLVPTVILDRESFLADRHGKTFVDVVDDPHFPFDEMLSFFNDSDRQRRMDESEIHHDRSPLAGVVRELESHPRIDHFLADLHPQRSKRFRQAVGVIVRIVMEQRGWQKTGRKGSMGVRAPNELETPMHNTGGLAFWFLRAERYEPKAGMPFRSVRDRRQSLTATTARMSPLPRLASETVAKKTRGEGPGAATSTNS